MEEVRVNHKPTHRLSDPHLEQTERVAMKCSYVSNKFKSILSCSLTFVTTVHFLTYKIQERCISMKLTLITVSVYIQKLLWHLFSTRGMIILSMLTSDLEMYYCILLFDHGVIHTTLFNNFSAVQYCICIL